MHWNAALGEARLIEGLHSVNIMQDAYETEPQQRERMLRQTERDDGKIQPTPDVLFKSPQTILGHSIHWIDAKNCFLIDGISPDKKIKDIVEKLALYTRLYGPGAVLWTKEGFDQSTVDLCNGTLCLRPLHSITVTATSNVENGADIITNKLYDVTPSPILPVTAVTANVSNSLHHAVAGLPPCPPLIPPSNNASLGKALLAKLKN